MNAPLWVWYAVGLLAVIAIVILVALHITIHVH